MSGFSLKGRKALVTGSGRGIGRAVAESLIACGARVAINDIDDVRAERCASELGESAIAVPGDVSNSSEVARIFEAMAESFGPIDVLVNNAGADRAIPLLEIDEAEWDRLMTINVKSVFLCTKAALPAMIEKGYGRVVSVSSMVARQGAMNGGIHYASSKAAILGFTRTLARQFAYAGITANAVAPGVIDTDLIAENMTADVRAKIVSLIPLKSMGDAIDVGAAVAFLASEESRYITGTVLDINGGFWIG
jgi:NAD(P)-dependent dehydrogenase (short-subunit alcohol dehydrogenase family)